MQFPRFKADSSMIIQNFLDFLYVTGIQTVRILKRVQKRAGRFFRPVAHLLKRIYGRTLGRQVQKAKQELVHFHQSLHGAARRIREEKENGARYTARDYVKTAKNGAVKHKRLLLTAVNIAVPAVCICLLAFTVQYWMNANYGLSLVYEGETIGVIQDEKSFERATEMVSDRMVYDTATQTDLSITPTFSLTRAENAQYTAPSAICDKIIERSDGIIEEASGLYVDGELVGAVKSSADLSFILQNILNTARGADKDAQVSFVENVETINGLFPTGSVVSAEKLNSALTGETESQAEYMVQTGDMATAIAQRYNLSLADLNQMNGDTVGDALQTGTTLKVRTASSLLNVKVLKKETYQEPIAFQTVTIKDDSQYTDYTKVKTEGKNGVQELVDEVTYINGVETGRKNLTAKVITEPVDKEVVTGTKVRPKLSGVGTGSMIWPVPSIHHITSYFEWRWGAMHTGLDISGGNSYGKTIVAADSGTVSYVRYSNVGYGNHLQINHGGGISTLYGHTSKILVESGQKVEKGQPIALIGSTGNSTGAHCHFEVIVNGKKVNPLNYVKN